MVKNKDVESGRGRGGFRMSTAHTLNPDRIGPTDPLETGLALALTTQPYLGLVGV